MAEKKYLVLADRLSKYEGTGDERQRLTFDKGDEVTLSEADAKRHLASGAITADLKADPDEDRTLNDLTVAELDALADANDVDDYPSSGKAAKVAALEAAGVQPA